MGIHESTIFQIVEGNILDYFLNLMLFVLGIFSNDHSLSFEVFFLFDAAGVIHLWHLVLFGLNDARRTQLVGEHEVEGFYRPASWLDRGIGRS